MGGNEDAFQQLKSALDRAIDQILSGIPESDHVDTMCVVIVQMRMKWKRPSSSVGPMVG